jgi:hypothetical protein
VVEDLDGKTGYIVIRNHVHGESFDLIQLQIRPDDVPPTWAPEHRFNLTGNRTIPFTTYAKFLVDTATSLGQAG